MTDRTATEIIEMAFNSIEDLAEQFLALSECSQTVEFGALFLSPQTIDVLEEEAEVLVQ